MRGKGRGVVASLLATALALIASGGMASAEGQSGTTLTANVTASARLTTTYAWSIDKSVTPTTINLFEGDSGDAAFSVAVTKGAATTVATISGEVCVENGGGVATEGLAITVNATMPPDSTVVESASVDVSGMPVLAPGVTYCYPYSLTIDNPVPGATYKITANVTITNHSGSLGTPKGPSPSATTTMPATAEVVNGSVNVDDTNGMSWAFNTSGTQTYTRTFTCDDEGVNVNTATIRETGQSDSASVTVNCYALSVAKTAGASYDRAWTWSIDKSVSPTSLTLATGQVSPPLNWSVTVTAVSADSGHTVSGVITVSNPAPMAATLTQVVDSYASVGATVTCPSLTVPAGGTLECTYTVPLGSAVDGTNTATATQQNYAYASDGTATASGTTDYSGSAAVTFGAPATETDECVDVTDTLQGVLGTVCAGDAPKTFTYTTTAGPYASPGTYYVDNTAVFVTNDTGTTGSDDAQVVITVPGNGCTLTQGYWKTHSTYGPAPYDDAWLVIGPLGADTLFFNSGMTWYQVFWTAPRGNTYYQLAHQYMAAKLNVLNGASVTSEVQSALTQAEALFASVSAGKTSFTKAQSSTASSLAVLLDAYNNGLTGPGHCSE